MYIFAKLSYLCELKKQVREAGTTIVRLLLRHPFLSPRLQTSPKACRPCVIQSQAHRLGATKPCPPPGPKEVSQSSHARPGEPGVGGRQALKTFPSPHWQARQRDVGAVAPATPAVLLWPVFTAESCSASKAHPRPSAQDLLTGPKGT